MINNVSNLATLLAREAKGTAKAQDAGHRPGALPTPPNSLSPTIPPKRGHSPSLAASNGSLPTVESDLDLLDNDHIGRFPMSSAADATGAITPALLAKHHLPDVLLNNGPVPMRDILAHLTQTVPGFAGIPQQKARRIVSSALENRAGGGLGGEIVFEKVGWGRWDAQYRDQARKEQRSGSSGASPPSHGTQGLRISLSRAKLRKPSAPISPFSPNYNHDEDIQSEDEADKMSLDGDVESRPRLNKRRFLPIHGPEDDEMTDEEDWEHMGPERVYRAASVSYAASFQSRRDSQSSLGLKSNPRPFKPSSVDMQNRFVSLPNGVIYSHDVARSLTYSGGILPFAHTYSQSLSSAKHHPLHSMQGVQEHSTAERDQTRDHQRQGSGTSTHPASYTAIGIPGKSSNSSPPPQEAIEREAIEALLQMGGTMPRTARC